MEQLIECAVASLRYLLSMDKLAETQANKQDKEFIGQVEDICEDSRHATKPFGTEGALTFDPLGLRRPILTPSEKEIIEGVIAAVARIIKADMIACNDSTFEPTRGSKELQMACSCNDNAFDALERRKETVDCVMEALVDPNTHIIGLYGSSDARKATLLQIVSRRVKRDNLFDVVLKATVTKKSKSKSNQRIQEEIALPLGLKLEKTCVAERAISLRDRIKKDGKVLVMLLDLVKGLDLGKVGIPCGTDHPGSKILLTVTSDSEEILTKQMRTQKHFLV